MADVDPTATGLRAKHTDETRAALIAAARKLFAERGYYEVGVREFAAAAGLTRGAIYHHFGGKEEIFLAVLDNIRSDQVDAAAKRHREPTRPDRWQQLRQDLQFALEDIMSPDVARILFVDAPSVLGWQRWRETYAKYGRGPMVKAIEQSVASGLIAPQPPLELAELISAAYIRAALEIAHSDEPDAALRKMGGALDSLLAGLYRLHD